MLCGGQQFVTDGIHPDTKEPYTWREESPLEYAPRRARRGHRGGHAGLARALSERLERSSDTKRVYTNGHDHELDDAGPVDVDGRSGGDAVSAAPATSHPCQSARRHGVAAAQGVSFDEVVRTVLEAPGGVA